MSQHIHVDETSLDLIRSVQISHRIVITSILVYNKNVTAVEGQSEIVTHCILTGFDVNPPLMEHDWYFKDQVG